MIMNLVKKKQRGLLPTVLERACHRHYFTASTQQRATNGSPAIWRIGGGPLMAQRCVLAGLCFASSCRSGGLPSSDFLNLVYLSFRVVLQSLLLTIQFRPYKSCVRLFVCLRSFYSLHQFMSGPWPSWVESVLNIGYM